MKLSSLLLPVLSLAFAATSFAGTTTSGKACTTCATPPAPEGLFDTIGATASIGYDTNYIFRGVQFAEHLVSADLDLVVPITNIFSLDLNAWYGASAGDHAAAFAGGHSYGELDLAATLSVKLDPVTIGLKYTWYDYVGNAGKFVEDVNEVGLTLATTVWCLDIGAGAYRDFTADGWYFEYFISHTFKINDWLSVVPGFLISHASHYYGIDGGCHMKPSLAVPIKLTKTATLTPYIAGNIPWGDLHRDGERDRVYGGAALSVTF